MATRLLHDRCPQCRKAELFSLCTLLFRYHPGLNYPLRIISTHSNTSLEQGSHTVLFKSKSGTKSQGLSCLGTIILWLKTGRWTSIRYRAIAIRFLEAREVFLGCLWIGTCRGIWKGLNIKSQCQVPQALMRCGIMSMTKYIRLLWGLFNCIYLETLVGIISISSLSNCHSDIDTGSKLGGSTEELSLRPPNPLVSCSSVPCFQEFSIQQP